MKKFYILIIFFSIPIFGMQTEALICTKSNVERYSLQDYFKERKINRKAYVGTYFDDYFNADYYELVLNNLKINSLHGLRDIANSIKPPIALDKIGAIYLKNNEFTSIDLEEDIISILPSCRRFILSGNPLIELKNIQALKHHVHLDIRSREPEKLHSNLEYKKMSQMPYGTITVNSKAIAYSLMDPKNLIVRCIKHKAFLTFEALQIITVVYCLSSTIIDWDHYPILSSMLFFMSMVGYYRLAYQVYVENDFQQSPWYLFSQDHMSYRIKMNYPK